MSRAKKDPLDRLREAISQGDPDNRVYRAIRGSVVRQIADECLHRGELPPEDDILELTAEGYLTSIGIVRHSEMKELEGSESPAPGGR